MLSSQTSKFIRLTPSSRINQNGILFFSILNRHYKSHLKEINKEVDLKTMKEGKKIKKIISSPAGNRTPVSRVTGGDTHHYTTEEVVLSTFNISVYISCKCSIDRDAVNYKYTIR